MYQINYHNQELAKLLGFPSEADLEKIVQICSRWELTVTLYQLVSILNEDFTVFAGEIRGDDGGGCRVALTTSDHIRSQAIAPYKSCLQILKDPIWEDWKTLQCDREIIEAIEKVRISPERYRIWNITAQAVVNFDEIRF